MSVMFGVATGGGVGGGGGVWVVKSKYSHMQCKIRKICHCLFQKYLLTFPLPSVYTLRVAYPVINSTSENF